MSGDKQPKTIGELFFYMQGEFKTLNEKIEGEKRFIIFVSGISGTIAGAVIVLFFKYIIKI